MSQLKSPVIKRSIPCPCCERQSEQMYISEKLYHVSKYDDDQHPAEYQWHQKEFEFCKPNYYEIFYCPYCFYCDTKDDYINGGDAYAINNGTLKRIKEIIKIKHNQQNQAYILLGSGIDIEKMTLNMSLNIHLLAIYIHELPEHELRDDQKLALLYQKTAWLYRESKDITVHMLTDETYDHFSNIFSQYYMNYKRFMKGFNFFKYHAKQALNGSRIELEHKEEYLDNLYKLENIFLESNNMNANLMNIQEFGIGQFRIENEEIRNTDPFKFKYTMAEFMEEMLLHWPYIPVAEQICLEHACDYFVQDMKNGKKKHTFANRRQNVNSIIPMCIRLEQYERAIDIITEHLTHVEEFLKLGKQRAARLKKYNSTTELEEVIGHLHTASLDEKHFEEKLREIKKLQNKRDLTIANTIVKTYPRATPKELLHHFDHAGISEETAKKFINYLLSHRQMDDSKK